MKKLASLIIPTLLLVPQLSAIIVGGSDPNNIIYASSHTAVGFSVSSIGQCSGSLLSTGRHFLTAAHCIMDNSGNLSPSATISFFNGSSTRFDYTSSQITANPFWVPGAYTSGSDLAIITLSSIVDLSIDRLSLYTGSGELNQTGTIIGYGRQGTGVTGGSGGTSGIRRQGQNVVDEIVGNNLILIYDFDDGTSARNSRGSATPTALESMIYSGDSGGPTLINGQIAGVHSFITCTSGSGGCQTVGNGSDLDGVLNGTFGERFGDARVSRFVTWINSVAEPTSVPEPATYAAGILALVTCLARARKNRNGSPN